MKNDIFIRLPRHGNSVNIYEFLFTILYCRGEMGGYWLLIANNDTTCSRLLTAEPGEDHNEETETHEDNIVAGLSDVWTDFNI